MKRDYTTGIEKDVTFFTGTEVEHTPAFGKKTLFVVEVQPVDYIELNLRGIEHIYFGSNMSFPKEELNYLEWDRWTTMIRYFLEKDYQFSDIIVMEGGIVQWKEQVDSSLRLDE